MALHATYGKRIFKFSFKARTSRGLMQDKVSWFIKLWHDSDPSITGVGECGPLPGLSPDAGTQFEEVLNAVIKQLPAYSSLDAQAIQQLVPAGFPSITFGLETAWLDLLHGGKRIIYQNEFIRGYRIPINGLIWMGDLDFMMNQINQKIAQGFRCIKIKVGGLDFDRECDVLRYIRKRYFREDLVIRLDANGAFKPGEALAKLNALAQFNIHSIEQPVKPGLVEMQELCAASPIPVAFDEELITVETLPEKQALLRTLKPHYVVLKPTLHGGLSGCAEWIAVAEQMGIGWWMTSALESAIGLNAICQFTGQYATGIPQGLGTGMIYENNFDSPLKVQDGAIFYDRSLSWSEESSFL